MSSRNEGDRSVADNTLSRALARRYGTLSRRSFLSVVSRKLVTLAGVPIAAQVFPYFASSAYAANEDCGLHGRICTPTCTGGTNQLQWVQCCITQECPTKYKCCHYIDKCGTRWPTYPSGCSGDASGTAWCSSGEYICTILSCDVSTYGNLTTCQGFCSGHGPCF